MLASNLQRDSDAVSHIAPILRRLTSVFTHSVRRVYAGTAALMLSLMAFPVFILLTKRKVQRAVLAVGILNISFQVEKHFFLRTDAADLGSLGGLQISVTNLALLCLCIAWIAGTIIRSHSSALPRRSMGMVILPASLLLMFYVVSLSVADDVSLGIFLICSVLAQFFLYLYIAHAVTSRADVLFIVRVLLVGLVIQSCLMLAQAEGLVGEIQFYFIRTMPGTFRDGRVIGTLGSPNAAASYLAMMMSLALGVLLGGERRADKYLAGTGFFLAAVALVFTGSRGGWISLSVGIATIIFFCGRRIPWKVFATFGILIVLVTIPLRGVIEARLYGDDNGAAQSRIPLNKLALMIIQDHPMLGVGANNYALVMRPYAVRGGLLAVFTYTVHNTYLLVWSETGIGGLIAFIWFMGAIVAQGIRSWRYRNPFFAPLSIGCAAAVAGFMVHSSFDIFRTGPAVDLMWLFGGLVTAMSRMSVRHDARQQLAPVFATAPRARYG